MLDLNVDYEVERRKTATVDSVDEFDCNSSTLKSSVSTLNFSILNEHVIEIEDDDVFNRCNELQLFPTGASPPSLTPERIRANYWLILSAPEVPGTGGGGGGMELGTYKALLPQNNQVQPAQAKKSRRGPRSRSSQYRGVTFYRRTGRWESHIWDCGRQVYLGGYDTAHAAARAYDRAAVKFRGVDADINFSVGDYEEEMKQTKNLTKQEFVQILRRQSNGFTRLSSRCRGVNLQKYGHQKARTVQFLGKKAYDEAAIKCNGKEAVTNFELSNYVREKGVVSGNGGNDSSLDLNLRISLSSDGSKRNNNSMQFPHLSNELLDVNRLKELDTRMSGEPVPFSGFSSTWPWKMPSHGVATREPMLASTSASSRFSNATSPYMASIVPLTSQATFPAAAFHIHQ